MACLRSEDGGLMSGELHSRTDSGGLRKDNLADLLVLINSVGPHIFNSSCIIHLRACLQNGWAGKFQWPWALHFNFWVCAERKTVQKWLFLFWKWLMNVTNVHKFHHFGVMLTRKSALRFGYGRSKSYWQKLFLVTQEWQQRMTSERRHIHFKGS